MFVNIGGKIKSLATILAVLGIIASIIIGCLMLDAGGGGLPGVLTIVGGSLLSWLSSFTLYGFGELIETNQSIDSKLDGLIQKTSNLIQNEGLNTSSCKTKSASNPNLNTKTKILNVCEGCHKEIEKYPCPHCGFSPKLKEIPIHPLQKEDGSIVCPRCGTPQRGDRYRCFSCGQAFINHQPDVPYWCGSCGTAGPFDGEECPKCGSTKKVLNQ